MLGKDQPSAPIGCTMLYSANTGMAMSYARLEQNMARSFQEAGVCTVAAFKIATIYAGMHDSPSLMVRRVGPCFRHQPRVDAGQSVLRRSETPTQS